MAMQAILAQQFDQFYRRLQLISAIPVNKFQERINDIKKLRIEWIDTIKDEVEKNTLVIVYL